MTRPPSHSPHAILPPVNPSTLALFALTLTCACSVLSPQPDRSRFYLLTEIDAAPAFVTASGDDPEIRIGLGPIQFPDYLGRIQMATRRADHRIEYAPLDLWAEPLDAGFTRVLLHDLGQRLPGARVVPHPWLGMEPPRYRIPLNLIRFEARDDRSVELTARWAVRDGDTTRLTRDSTIHEPIEGNGAAAVAAALSRAVARLSDEMASTIVGEMGRTTEDG